MSVLESFDFMDDDWFAVGDPHAVWRELRRHEPVFWHERGGLPGFWLLSKHADVVAVSRNSETFVCERGTGPISPRDRAAPPAERLPRENADRLLNMLDPPDHTVMRRIVSYAFTPRTIARLEPVVRDTAGRLLDDLAWRGEGDFVAEVTTRIPLAVLGSLMGFPEENWQQFARWTADMGGEVGPDDARDPEARRMAAAIARAEVIRYLRELVTARREVPKDDLVSDLLAIEEQGRLSDAELMMFCFLLVNAGHDTTRNALSGGVLALLENPAERLRLQNDPTLVESAVEEVCRWTSPIVHFGRFVTRDTELRGRQIRAGQRVVMLYPSANRDEDVFDDPDRFDVGREPNDHVAFGAGRHFCLGAALARLQLRIVLPMVFERIGGLELSGTPQRVRSNFVSGLSRLPVRAAPAAKGLH